MLIVGHLFLSLVLRLKGAAPDLGVKSVIINEAMMSNSAGTDTAGNRPPGAERDRKQLSLTTLTQQAFISFLCWL